MEKDVKWRDYFEDNCRYADIINGLGCAGKQLVSPDDLTELDTRSKTKTRDLIRKTALGMNFAIIGIENQDELDYGLPVRIMNYDTLHYKKQLAYIRKKVRSNPKGLESGEYLYGFKKDNQLYPVVTFVLYAGEKPWTAATSLHEIIDFKDIPETLKTMVSDYKIQVIDIRRLQDTSIFKTDIRYVFDFLRCCEDRDALFELVTKEDYYQNVDQDAYEVIAKYANTKGIINLETYKNSEGGIDMCKGLRDLITDSKAEGRAEGRAEALVHTYQKLKQPKEDAINALIEEYNVAKEDAIELVEKYWK